MTISTSSGIYCFENIIDNKKYIGKASNIRKRIDNHLYTLRRNADSCTLLQRAWTKHGEDKFIWYVIKECRKEDLNKFEKRFIKKLNTNNREKGYNLTSGGEGLSDIGVETRNKMSLSKVGVYDGNKNPMFGRKHSENTKNKQREKRFGKKLSEETKNKISISQNGNKHYSVGIKKKDASSLYFSVIKHRHKNYFRWHSEFRYNSVRYNVGYFKTEIEAAIAYDKYIKNNEEIIKPLNFPNILHTINILMLFKVYDFLKRTFSK